MCQLENRMENHHDEIFCQVWIKTLFMKRYMCNIADMCLNLGVDDRDDDVRSGRGEYWPHDVAASLSSLPQTLPRTAEKGKMEKEVVVEEEEE